MSGAVISFTDGRESFDVEIDEDVAKKLLQKPDWEDLVRDAVQKLIAQETTKIDEDR